MKREPKERADYRRADFEHAMQALLQRKQLTIVPYGPPSAGNEKLVRADQPVAEEIPFAGPNAEGVSIV